MSNTKSAIEIGQIFLNKAEEKGMELTTMQLLKIVYIAHGWMLGLCGRSLISDQVEAWQYGPVIRSLYEKIRHTRGNPITEKISDTIPELDEQQQAVINGVFNGYGVYTGWHLSNITHKTGTPWHTCRIKNHSSKIPNDIIEEYYKDLVQEDANKST